MYHLKEAGTSQNLALTWTPLHREYRQVGQWSHQTLKKAFPLKADRQNWQQKEESVEVHDSDDVGFGVQRL